MMHQIKPSSGFLTIAALAVLLSSTGCNKQAQDAHNILKETGTKGGLIVQPGAEDGKFLAGLHAGDGFLVHGLVQGEMTLGRVRDEIDEQGVYGPVSAEIWEGGELPYTDNMVNLIIAKELYGTTGDEIMRVLVPGGKACIMENGEWQIRTKDRPDDIDEWTHYMHGADNNAVAHDEQVETPRHLQWAGKPLYCRSHEFISSVHAMVTAAGRIFYIVDEGPTGIKDPRLPSKWSLVARDAFNGVTLWKKEMPEYGWREWDRERMSGKDWNEMGLRFAYPRELYRGMVVDGNRLYVTLGYRAPVSVIDAATGEILRVVDNTRGAHEIITDRNKLIIRKQKNLAGEPESSENEIIMAVDAETGETDWQKEVDRLNSMTLASRDGKVYYSNAEGAFCMDIATGDQIWQYSRPWINSLVSTGKTVLLLHHTHDSWRAPNVLTSLSAETGEPLWQGPEAQGSDLFFANNLVWYGHPREDHEGRRLAEDLFTGPEPAFTLIRASGYDQMTGEVRKHIEIKNLISPGHHYRCYPGKATDKYLLLNKRGVEFLDLSGNRHMRNDWVRGSCWLGLMPANGLLYSPPHPCFCYIGAKLSGFNALSGRIDPDRWNGGEGPLLEKGPAYDSPVTNDEQENNDWPTFRHDPARSGTFSGNLPVRLQKNWEAGLGGKLTQPVIAGGNIYVAQKDMYRLCCLDAGTGNIRWTYTAGGRIDSPPTVYQGTVLFGSADGWVYCLRASDGKPAWRFRAAPHDRRMVAFNRLESAWPVHGSVLVKDGTAYFAAGRSSYLDGGIYLYGLDPVNGEIRYEKHLEGPYPEIPEECGRPFDMEGHLPDVLVADENTIFMRRDEFTPELERKESRKITQFGDSETGLHLFSTSASGLLDDSWWDRSFWMYSRRWPGYYIGNQAPKAGQILAFNDSLTYGLKCFVERNVHSPFSRPGKGYLLYADHNHAEPILVDTTDSPEAVKWLPGVKKGIADFYWRRWEGNEYCDPAVNFDKGPGLTRAEPTVWQEWVPVRARAMLLARNALFIAGPPDIIDPEDPLLHLEERDQGYLWIVSPASGEKIAGYKLDASPVFDGMAAANENLFIATRSGKLLCFGKIPVMDNR